MPDIGTIRPTFTSAGACARATPDRPIAAAPESTGRRVTKPFDVLFFMVILPKFSSVFLHSKISTFQGKPAGRGRPREASACRLRAPRDRLPAHNRGRLTPALRPRAARPEGWSVWFAGGFRSAGRK